MNQSMKTLSVMAVLGLAFCLAVAVQSAGQAVKITNGPIIEKAGPTSATIAWSTNQGSSSRVWYGTDKNNLTHLAEAPYSGGTHRVQINGLKPNTTYYFQVESGQGRGGSESESQGVLAFKTVAAGKPPVSNEKPMVAEKGQANEENGKVKITSGPTIQKVNANSAVVTWTTNVKGSSRVSYGTDANNLTQLAEAPWGSGGLTHTVTINNLKPNTTYYFQVETGQAQGTGGAEVDANKVMSFKTTAPGAPAQAAYPAQAAKVPPATTPTTAQAKEPLYRLTSNKSEDRLYTTSSAEAKHAEVMGYRMEGVAGYVEPKPAAGDEPLYRLVRQKGNHIEHFYTANPAEKGRALREGYREEGIAGYVARSQEPGTVPLERLEQPSTGEYLFTTSRPEAQQATARSGYQQQGICCYIWQR